MLRYPAHNIQNVRSVQSREVIRVPLVVVVAAPAPRYIAPHMRREARVVIDRPEVVAPGLKLGDWSQVEDVEPQAVGQ